MSPLPSLILCPGDGAVFGLYYGHPVYGSIMLMSSLEKAETSSLGAFDEQVCPLSLPVSPLLFSMWCALKVT